MDCEESCNTVYIVIKKRNIIALYQQAAKILSTAWQKIIQIASDPLVDKNIEEQAKIVIEILELASGNTWSDFELQKKFLFKVTLLFQNLTQILENNSEVKVFITKNKEALAVFATTIIQKGKPQYLFFDKLETLKTEYEPDLKHYYNLVEGMI